MKAACVRLIIPAALISGTALIWAQQVDRIAEHRKTADASLLHQRVREAGGELKQVRRAGPERLAADLPSLLKQSEEVLLVEIVRNSCEVSPRGVSP